MNEIRVMKVTFTGALAALTVHLGVLALPVVLLIGMMIVDYITGLMAAAHRGQEISSYRSIGGVAKKICLLLLVAVGLALDLLVEFCREFYHFDFPWSFVIAAIIAVWLTVSEVISVLENMLDIGVGIPPWLLPLVKNIKSKAESISPKFGEDEHNDSTSDSSDK